MPWLAPYPTQPARHLGALGLGLLLSCGSAEPAAPRPQLDRHVQPPSEPRPVVDRDDEVEHAAAPEGDPADGSPGWGEHPPAVCVVRLTEDGRGCVPATDCPSTLSCQVTVGAGRSGSLALSWQPLPGLVPPEVVRIEVDLGAEVSVDGISDAAGHLVTLTPEAHGPRFSAHLALELPEATAASAPEGGPDEDAEAEDEAPAGWWSWLWRGPWRAVPSAGGGQP